MTGHQVILKRNISVYYTARLSSERGRVQSKGPAFLIFRELCQWNKAIIKKYVFHKTVVMQH